MKLRPLLVSAAAGALVIAGPAATALADPGGFVLASSHEDEDDDHGHSHDDDGHSHEDEDHDHGYEDHDDDAEVLPSVVDAGSGGLSTGALPVWILSLMALGALGLLAPMAAVRRRR